eukprot:6423082-Pyramimonas_sp.AAC.2
MEACICACGVGPRDADATSMGTNHRGSSGSIPVWGPITGDPAGIYPPPCGYIPATMWEPITCEPAWSAY